MAVVLQRKIPKPPPGSTHIVVGVDSGKFSESAFRRAIKLFKSQSSYFSIVHVRPNEAEFLLQEAHMTREQRDEMQQFRRERCHEILEKYRTLAEKEKLEHFDTVELQGDPREELCTFCMKTGADILVLGTRSVGPLKRVFLGSVSLHCAHNATCPVLVHREEEEGSAPPAGDSK